jgi:hypothetical protein
VLQSRREHDLPLETLQTHFGGELRREHLDDHLASERDVGRQKDARHPAAGELALDRVGRAERRLELGAEVRDHKRPG